MPMQADDDWVVCREKPLLVLQTGGAAGELSFWYRRPSAWVGGGWVAMTMDPGVQRPVAELYRKLSQAGDMRAQLL